MDSDEEWEEEEPGESLSHSEGVSDLTSLYCYKLAVVCIFEHGDVNLAFRFRMTTMKEETMTTMMMGSLCPMVISQKGKEHLKMR